MDFPITEKEAKIRLGETAVLSSGGAKRFASFLRTRKNELEYRLNKALWAFGDDQIAVRFQYEYHDKSGQWFRTYGNEFSINHDRPITMEFQNSVSDRYFQSIRHRLSERVGLAWHLRLATGQKPLRHQAPKRRPCPHSNRISSYAVSDWRPSSPNGPQDLLDYKPL